MNLGTIIQQTHQHRASHAKEKAFRNAPVLIANPFSLCRHYDDMLEEHDRRGSGEWPLDKTRLTQSLKYKEKTFARLTQTGESFSLRLPSHWICGFRELS